MGFDVTPAAVKKRVGCECIDLQPVDIFLILILIFGRHPGWIDDLSSIIKSFIDKSISAFGKSRQKN
jgi:hypothetical protein